MTFEESRGLKCNKSNLGVKPTKLAADFLVSISRNGTTEGGLGEVIHGVRSLVGQALAIDWPKDDRFLDIKWGRKFQIFCIKLATIWSVFEKLVRGLLFSRYQGSILEILVHFGMSLKLFRAWPKNVR